MKDTNTEYDIQKRTFNFALETIKYCRKVKERENEHILTNQLIRSSTSVGANMREARNAESKADFIHKLAICQKECDESLYWLELMMSLDERENNDLKFCHEEAQQILKIVRTISLKTKESSVWKKR